MSGGIQYVGPPHRSAINVMESERREPTEKDFADPRFDIIWALIKHMDVTGNDVCAVLDRLDAATGRTK